MRSVRRPTIFEEGFGLNRTYSSLALLAIEGRARGIYIVDPTVYYFHFHGNVSPGGCSSGEMSLPTQLARLTSICFINLRCRYVLCPSVKVHMRSTAVWSFLLYNWKAFPLKGNVCGLSMFEFYCLRITGRISFAESCNSEVWPKVPRRVISTLEQLMIHDRLSWLDDILWASMNRPLCMLLSESSSGWWL